MATKKVAASTLTLKVDGTKLEVPVTITKLASSTAGTSGFTLRTVCAVHKAPLQAPKVCPECGDKPEATLKGYPYSKPMGYMTPETFAALKPSGDNTVEIVGALSNDVLRDMSHVMRVVPEARTLTPVDNEPPTLKRFAAVAALLGERTWLARITHRASFYNALVRFDPWTGALMVLQTYLVRDTKDAPASKVTQPDEYLSEKEVAALAAKGNELAATVLDMSAFDLDPHRDAREVLVMAAIENPDSISVETAPVVPKPAQEEDLLALL